MSITSKYDLSVGDLLLTEDVRGLTVPSTLGLVLVLISSILCNVCINHKCKKADLKISQNDERVVPTEPPHEIEDVFSPSLFISVLFVIIV
jgi:hypothetical protein